LASVCGEDSLPLKETAAPPLPLNLYKKEENNTVTLDSADTIH